MKPRSYKKPRYGQTDASVGEEGAPRPGRGASAISMDYVQAVHPVNGKLSEFAFGALVCARRTTPQTFLQRQANTHSTAIIR
eukprot:4764146-Amphidinium_carterae.1